MPWGRGMPSLYTYNRRCAFSTCPLALSAIQSGASNVRDLQFSGSQPAKYGAIRPTRVKKTQSGWTLLLAYYLHLLSYNMDWWWCLSHIYKKGINTLFYIYIETIKMVLYCLKVFLLYIFCGQKTWSGEQSACWPSFSRRIENKYMYSLIPCWYIHIFKIVCRYIKWYMYICDISLMNAICIYN